MTDDLAAKIGAKLQEQDPDLFKALDTDGDGTLTAKELEAGKDKIKKEMEAAGMGGLPPMTDDLAAKIGAKIQEQDPDLFKALDTDGDGTLTAKELEAGKDKVHDAMRAQVAGGPPEMTDEMAATIGSSIQKDNAALFKSLDADGDGKLTAKELKAGLDAIRQAMEANGMMPPPPPPGEMGGSGSSTDESESDQISQLLGSTQSSTEVDYRTNLMQEILQSIFAKSQQS
jgi:Ca2+-binding EF-hand superfamily protein